MKSMSITSRPILSSAILFALLATGVTKVAAADKIWNGAGDGTTMSSGANWVGNVAPVAGTDRLIFAGTTGLNINDDYAAGAQFNGIIFSNNAGAFTISGANYIKIGGNVTNYSTATQTIGVQLQQSANWNYYTVGNMVFTNLYKVTLNAVGPGTIWLVGPADNNTGIANVSNGVVVLAKDSTSAIHALGGNSTVASGGMMIIAGTGGDQVYSRAGLRVDGKLQVQTNESMMILWGTNGTGVVENGLAGTTNVLSLVNYNNPRGVFSGKIQDGTAGALEIDVTGGGTPGIVQEFDGTNTYSGPTKVFTTSAGVSRLIVNGQHTGGGDYSVYGSAAGNTAALCGRGTISATAVNIGAYGTLSPGGSIASETAGSAFSDTRAVMTFSNAVNLTDATSTLDIQLNNATAGSGYDQVNIAGSGSFSNNAANLKLTVSGGSVGDKFTIVKVQGTDPANNIGTFATLNGAATDLSQGAIFVDLASGTAFQISYRAEGSTFDAGAGNGNDIMLQIVTPVGASLTWRGNGVNNNWDINTTADWTTNVVNLTTFTNGNFVTFDNYGSNDIPVNVAETVTPGSLTLNASKNYVIGGAGSIAGNFTTIKTNTGTVAIVNTNDNLAGTTIIQSGTLQIGTNNVSGSWSGNVVVNPGGTLAYMRSDDSSLALPVSGSGSFVHSGSGALLITNTLTAFTGSTVNSNGLLQIGDGSSTLGSIGGTVLLGATNTLRYYFKNNMTVQNSVGGSGTVDYESDGNNTWTFTIPATIGSTNFTGTNYLGIGIKLLTPNDGVMYALGNGSIVNATALGSQLSLGRGTYNQSLILAGDGVAGTGALNAYRTVLTGPITLAADTTITYNGGTISGVVSGGTYNLKIIGNTGQYPNNELILAPTNGVNSYGNTTITGGFVKCGNAGALSTNSLAVDATGWLDVNGNTVTVADFQNGASGGGFIGNASTVSNATLVVGSDNSSTAFDGVFGDGATKPLSLTKIGSGTLTLSGVSTNTGTIAVQGGTLALTGSGSFNNASVISAARGAIFDVSAAGGILTLNNGQTLKGSGTINGSLTAGAGSTVNPGDGVGALTISGNATLSGALLIELNRTNSPATNDSLIVTGTLTAGGALTVTNLGPVLHAGDSFQLFSTGVSGFASVNLPTTDTANNVAYTWNNTLASNGKITVQSVSSLVNTNSTNIIATVGGGNLTLSWPADHTGWTLQAQTNALSAGLGTNWVTVAGSTTTNQVVMPINAANASVFFRLKY